MNSPATTAPARLCTPPMSTAASRMIESWVGNWKIDSWPTLPASRPPATPAMKLARANAHSL